MLVSAAPHALGLGPRRGVIIGSLFSGPGSFAAIEDLHAGAASAIWGSRGKYLASDLWGSYLAILDDPAERSVQIVRAPCSFLPCYYVDRDSELVLASDVKTLIEAGYLQPTIDWDFVKAHLSRPALRTARTGIAGLTELQWGERLTKCSGKPSAVDVIWSPWDFTDRNQWVSDSRQASESIRAAVKGCARAWATRSRHILLGVSGGLDSSILAACLADSGASFDLVTLVTQDAVGDERPFASMLAEALGVSLLEMPESPDAVDLRCSHAAHLPRPLARSFAQSSDATSMRLAKRLGIDGFWSGGGGDSVFCLLQSTAPVADRLLAEGLGHGALRTACDLSRLTGASLARIIPKSIERAWWRLPDYPWRADMSFLSADAIEASSALPAHPWLTPPEHALPGRAAHVAALWGIQNYLEGFIPARDYATVYPLLSQPVVEACLRVPSWIWCEGGVNRAAARHAFAGDLPEPIIRRSSKGSPSGLVMQIYEQRRDEIRTLLTGGRLAGAGLLDLAALNAELSRPGPVRGLNYSRILTLVDVEAWLSSWDARNISADIGFADAAARLSPSRNVSQWS